VVNVYIELTAVSTWSKWQPTKFFDAYSWWIAGNSSQWYFLSNVSKSVMKKSRGSSSPHLFVINRTVFKLLPIIYFSWPQLWVRLIMYTYYSVVLVQCNEISAVNLDLYAITNCSFCVAVHVVYYFACMSSERTIVMIKLRIKDSWRLFSED